MPPVTGWFDPSSNGGAVRLAANSYLPAKGDPGVRLPGLRRGDLVTLENGKVASVNGAPPARLVERPEFAKLGAVHPARPLVLESLRASSPRTAETQRVVDLICPFGFGQRALIVSPPKAGKTMMLQAIAVAKPKGLSGAARAVPDGGSLTVIATALVETESRMDDVIFEEFKGTGNAELRLSRALADRRVYPAVDVAASGTRREELLADPATVAAKQQLRRGLVGLPPEKAMEGLLAQLRRTKTNAELLKAVS